MKWDNHCFNLNFLQEFENNFVGGSERLREEKIKVEWSHVVVDTEEDMDDDCCCRDVEEEEEEEEKFEVEDEVNFFERLSDVENDLFMTFDKWDKEFCLDKGLILLGNDDKLDDLSRFTNSALNISSCDSNKRFQGKNSILLSCLIIVACERLPEDIFWTDDGWHSFKIFFIVLASSEG